MNDHNPNPTGKGGFKEHPENINKHGSSGAQGLRLLREALARKETRDGVSLFDLFVELAHKDKNVMIDVMKKLVPNAQSIEVTGEMTLKDFFSVLRGEEINPDTMKDKEKNNDEANHPSD